MTGTAWMSLIILLLTVLGCGVIGPPVPPNAIGVNVKRRHDAVEEQRRMEEARQRQHREGQVPGAEEPAGPVPRFLEDAPLQREVGEVVPPSARPDSDFLVRPR